MNQVNKKCTVAESERILGMRGRDQLHNKREQMNYVKKTYTVTEAGNILGLSRASTYAAIKRGEIPSFRIGNKILIPKEAFDRKVAGHAPREVTNRID